MSFCVVLNMTHEQINTLISDDGYAGLNPILFGYQDCAPGHYFGPTLRTYWLIHYVVSGKGIFEINGEKYTLSKGMMFVIPPYVQTYYQADKEQPWSYIWVGFTCDRELPTHLDPVISCPHAGSIFQAMKDCAAYRNGRSAFLCAKLWELFSCLKEQQAELPDPVDYALFAIHAEYMTDLGVQQLADRVRLDRSYFSSLFKKKVGISPGKYLLDYRMKRACELLCNHGCSVAVTANSVGYADAFVFSKIFKKHYGCSPNAFSKKTMVERGER